MWCWFDSGPFARFFCALRKMYCGEVKRRFDKGFWPIRGQLGERELENVLLRCTADCRTSPGR